MVNATPIRSEDGELESFVVTYLDDRQQLSGKSIKDD